AFESAGAVPRASSLAGVVPHMPATAQSTALQPREAGSKLANAQRQPCLPGSYRGAPTLSKTAELRGAFKKLLPGPQRWLNAHRSLAIDWKKVRIERNGTARPPATARTGSAAAKGYAIKYKREKPTTKKTMNP